jgi:hypothetical protein
MPPTEEQDYYLSTLPFDVTQWYEILGTQTFRSEFVSNDQTLIAHHHYNSKKQVERDEKLYQKIVEIPKHRKNEVLHADTEFNSKVIELNPFGKHTGPCMYTWQHDHELLCEIVQVVVMVTTDLVASENGRT